MTTSLAQDGLAPECLSDAEIGGKASHLKQLHALGYPVPRFYVVSSDALRVALGDMLLHDPNQTLTQWVSQIRNHLEEFGIPSNVWSDIESMHRNCFAVDEVVAVRSSCAHEDGAKHSFAGIHESKLGVSGLESVEHAIRQVWLSAFSDRAMAYRERCGIPHWDVGMAVIVQRMIDAESSGVCFTCDPVTGARNRILICSMFGLGEGVVSEGLPADTFEIDRDSRHIHSRIVRKTERFVLRCDCTGTQQIAVPETDQERASLTGEQVRQVSETAVALEDHFGGPQDIEFCVNRDGQYFLLQSRPITGCAGSEGAGIDAAVNCDDGERVQSADTVIWDNSNIIESYFGITTPMTFSFIRRAYSIVYRCFADVMGISPRVVERNRETFDNMLGLHRGRVFYNLKNWYRLVQLFPGYHYNRKFMEAMMGVKESLAIEQNHVPVGHLRRWFVEFPSLVRLVGRSSWNFFRIRSIVGQFQQHFNSHYEEWSRINFEGMPLNEIKRLHDMMEKKMLWNWQAPIINDFYVMIFYGLLRKMCVDWCGDETASLQNGLVCGEGGLDSDEPAKLLIRMSQVVKNDEQLRDLILHGPLEDLHETVSSNPRFHQLHTLVERYLNEFGLRCANELKLESLSYRDQPSRLYALIRRYVAAREGAVGDLEAIQSREQELRAASEEQAFARLSQSHGWLPRRLIFQQVLKNARMGIRNRENMRFARTRIYGILRQMLRAIGQQLADQRVLAEREDIFYLTIDEVWDYLRGTSVTTDLAGLVELRKEEFESYRAQAPPANRFETSGLPYLQRAQSIKVESCDTDNESILKGISCCPGVVSGIVRVIRDPDAETAFDGEILVAERTDPGWVPFFPGFSGILIERGSVLSHSAIVAREMGIPTIVGITGLTARLQSGQRVRMDGRTGVVRLLTG